MSQSKHQPTRQETREPGLGELLRHLLELVDGSADRWYATLNGRHRARFTPVMRVLTDGPLTIKELQQRLSVTQGAISQTTKLMLDEQLICKRNGEDARQTVVALTAAGERRLAQLQPHWDATFEAIRKLERENGLPLMVSLRKTIAALETKPFAERVGDAKTALRERRPNA